MKRKTSAYNVLLYDINKNCIVWRDIFSLGCWKDMETCLRARMRKLRKAGPEYLKQELERIRSSYAFRSNDGLKRLRKDTPRILLVCYLDSICKSMFWSRFEFETYVHGLRSQDLKLDVYGQLKANWDIFVELVLRRIGYGI